ncbi:MAG: alpha/beta fold hydrolase [Pseudomonadota bacterium]
MTINATLRCGVVLTAIAVLSACTSSAEIDESHDAEAETWTEFSYEPYPLPYFIEDEDRYPAAEPPAGSVNRHGELEYLGNGVFGAHWFVGANDAVWHFVSAGDPADEAVLLIHGHPDTWYAYSKVMDELAETYYVIAVDTLGYGQSDKRPEIDVSYAAVAQSLIKLLDNIDITDFNLITHDRGSVISDHLIAADGMPDRIQAFLRMQQSFDKPHGYPRPAHEQMATAEWQGGNVVRGIYDSNYVSVHVPEDELARLEWEFQFPGTPEAAARTFQGTSFEIEREFRLENTIPNMTMPVVILQGIRDPGQHPEEYFDAPDLLPNGRVVFVDANHFIHTEDPQTVARIARDLFEHKNENRPNRVSSEPVTFLYPEKR